MPRNTVPRVPLLPPDHCEQQFAMPAGGRICKRSPLAWTPWPTSPYGVAATTAAPTWGSLTGRACPAFSEEANLSRFPSGDQNPSRTSLILVSPRPGGERFLCPLSLVPGPLQWQGTRVKRQPYLRDDSTAATLATRMFPQGTKPAFWRVWREGTLVGLQRAAGTLPAS